MKYHYLKWIDNNFDLQELSQYSLINQTRIDKQSIRFYRQLNDHHIIYYDIINHSDYYQNQLNNEGIKKMNLNEFLNKKQSAKTNQFPELTKTAKPTIENQLEALKRKSVDEKLNVKKGIAKKETELTIEKFNQIENIMKSLNGFHHVIGIQSGKIDNIEKDVLNFSKVIKSMQDIQIENNQLLISIAKGLNQVNSIQTVKIQDNRKGKEVKKENVNIELNENASDIENLYQCFMNHFNSKFCKSKKLDKLLDFQELINAIDFENPDTINESLRKQWTMKRENENKFYFAPKLLKNAIDAMIKTINQCQGLSDSQINQDIGISKVNSEVKGKSYYAKKYGLKLTDIDSYIKVIQENELNQELIDLIDDSIDELTSNDEIIDNDEILEYLVAYKK